MTLSRDAINGLPYVEGVRVPVERDHGFRWNVIIGSGGR